MASIGVNYGLENHDFDSDRNLVGIETELEAIGLTLKLERFIGKWTVGLGAKYTVGSTVLKYDQDRFRHFEGVNGVTSESIITSYNLYNTYSRTDVFANLDYRLAISRTLVLRPSVSVGSDIYASALGDYFATKKDLVSLSDKPDYSSSLGLYGELGMTLHYNINKLTSISLGFFIESSRRYNIQHTVRPCYVQLGAAWTW